MATNSIEVYVKMPSGKSSKYDIRSSETMGDLCQMIAKDERVDANHVRLKYQGKVLNKGKSMSQYGVRVETILKAELLVPKAISFSLQLPNGDMDGIECYNLDSVSSLFVCVAEKVGKTHHQISLKCGSKNLDNSSVTILDSGLVPESLIVASIKTKAKERENDISANDMEEEEKDAILTSFQTDGKRVDVVFSFDTTGSMYSYLTEVRSHLQSCCTRLLEDIPGIRIGIMAHGDYCDEGSPYVLRSTDLTDSIDTLVSFVRDVPSTSGGDSPECYEWVLRKAQNLDWSEDSAKALVVIGDLYPHPPSYTDQSIKWRDELDILKGMGVKVYGVQAGRNIDATKFYAEISEVSGGKHLNLQHFDIVKDMFMAVCYKEGNEEMLEVLEEELQSTGNMTDERMQMFSRLKENKDSREDTPPDSQRYVSSSWWDHTLDITSTPSYKYNDEKDAWSSNTHPLEYTDAISSVTTHTTNTRKTHKTRRAKRCVIS